MRYCQSSASRTGRTDFPAKHFLTELREGGHVQDDGGFAEKVEIDAARKTFNDRHRLPACGAGDSIKPGVERSGTPGSADRRTTARGSGR